jgi:hypothetical protein
VVIIAPRPFPLSTHPAFDIEPVSDWCVLSCFFNPAGFLRPVFNLGAFLDWCYGNRLPLFMTELCFHDALPVLPPNHPHVLQARLLDSGVMFQKEALLSQLAHEISVPKMFFCDADIVFSNPSCFIQAAWLLEHARLVQPFSRAIWQDVHGAPYCHKESTASGWLGPHQAHSLDPRYFHPGFAFGLTREFFRQVGGLYGCPLTGTGDAALFQSALAPLLPLPIKGASYYTAPAPADWRERVCQFVDGRVAAVAGDAIHFWHGTTKARAYDQRHHLLAQFDPGRDLTLDPISGLPTWTEAGKPLQEEMMKYFRSRQEDEV